MHNLATDPARRSQLEQQRARLRTWYDANGETLPQRYIVPTDAGPTGHSATPR